MALSDKGFRPHPFLMCRFERQGGVQMGEVVMECLHLISLNKINVFT